MKKLFNWILFLILFPIIIFSYLIRYSILLFRLIVVCLEEINNIVITPLVKIKIIKPAKNVYRIIKISIFLNFVDYAVFTITGICLILLYKFPTEMGEININVVISIFAASMFYYVTILIPRIIEIRKMNNNITNSIKNIFLLIFTLIRGIKKEETGEYYTAILDFMECVVKDKEKTKKDFWGLYCKPEHQKLFVKVITLIKDEIEIILINYSHLLPTDIKLKLTRFCTVSYKQTDLMANNEEFTKNQYFEILKELVTDMLELSTYTNIEFNEKVL
ncbi:hypothetical protein [Macellibacteroides fermentans]|uniref:Uncharacterized protein n=1 Tax=Parabacteroides chartae TaxID=1037355 RepID=A0A1T5B891_9BACT|nr:hypothetical protein [Parabacteroides chartae]SKB43385.1 hypothetical protein SAMN05660349_01131 [Parabacteroides chartae]